jgi:hypothetical protein
MPETAQASFCAGHSWRSVCLIVVGLRLGDDDDAPGATDALLPICDYAAANLATTTTMTMTGNVRKTNSEWLLEKLGALEKKRSSVERSHGAHSKCQKSYRD